MIKVGAITIGQAPRTDVTKDILPLLGEEVELIQAGGLDGLTREDPEAKKLTCTLNSMKFIQDRTVFKGVARYDGQPVIREGFALMNINNTDPTTSIDFAPDTANTEESGS